MDQETWRPVAGYEGLYIVSDFGHFQRVSPAIGARIGQNLRGGKMGYGENRYRTVRLCRSPEDHKLFKASRLVASVFLGPPPTPRHQVNHKNGVRNDDRVVNLEWTTPSENTRHRFDVLKQQNPRGEDHNHAVLTEAQVGAIKAARLNGASYGMIADHFPVTLGHVKNICAGRMWGHVAPTESEIRGRKPRPFGVNSKLTPDMVRDIKRSTERGVDLAKRYGVTQFVISAVRRGHSWAHVQ